ncbi:hypothetical protein ACSBR1_035959 [Camellia fascicularis]
MYIYLKQQFGEDKKDAIHLVSVSRLGKSYFDGEGVAVVCFDNDDSAPVFGGKVAMAAAAVVVVATVVERKTEEVVVVELHCWLLLWSRISVLVNGSPTDEFSPSKGLRQVDPLSPFLFNIVVEGLNLLLARAKDLGLIKGVSVGHSEIQLTHLQFADDTLLFCEAEEAEVVTIKRILRCFQIVSGLKINFHKSVLCGVGIEEALAQVFASKLNCQCQKLPIKYLGLPLGANIKSRKSWQPVVDKVKSKLALWKRSVAKTIDRLQAAFLWGSSEQKRKVHLVKWKEITTSKKQGGLGIVNLKEMNSSLLLKWWWRYGEEDKALGKKIINSRHGAIGGSWLPKLEPSGRVSAVWNGILSGVEVHSDLLSFFLSSTEINLGDGKRVFFWLDKWLRNMKLKDEFPRLFSLSTEKEDSLEFFVQRKEDVGSWHLTFRRPLRSWEEAEVSRLYALLAEAPTLRPRFS